MDCSTHNVSVRASDVPVYTPRPQGCGPLAEFRDGVYLAWTHGRDALMNLGDALLTDTQARSLAELALSPHFARQWHSVYQGVQRATLNRTALQRVFAAFAPAPAPGTRLVLGLDASPMARPCSDTGADRMKVHQANLPKGCTPVTVGWQFSSLVVLPDVASSWTYVLDTQRIPTAQTPSEVGAAQLAALVPLLAARALLLADRHYSSVAFLLATYLLPCDQLLRLARHRVLYRAAPAPTGRAGRPKQDGARLQGKDPSTQGEPDAAWDGQDAQGRATSVRVWHHLHFRQCRHIEVSVIEVTRHYAQDTKRDPKRSWFVWHGQDMPPLCEIAGLYKRRYSHEHGFRMDKQNLLWDTPRLRTPEQMQTWTDVVNSVRNQLVLARSCVTAHLQPWHSKERASTPQQVRRALSKIIWQLGTPSRVCQLRGKAPGRARGALVKPALRFEVVVKTKYKPKKTTEIV